MEELVIPSGNGRLAGSLYVPVSRGAAPAVVFVHGAGPAVRSDGYRELASHFAQKGIAALIYDKRGCGESDGDWESAGLHDLAGDALACARLLRGRPEINRDWVGLWGLSQGASIIPLAAAEGPEVAFVIAVGGCMDFEEQMRYFRANVFRRAGYSRALLDIANKADLARMDFANRVRSGALPAPRAWRERCRFEFDLDHAAVWRRVRQPVLAIYGQNDRQVPVAESSAAMSAALKGAGNRDFTLAIYPNASHSIGQTRTGELGEKWIGYVPEYLEEMVVWVLQRTTDVDGMELPRRVDHVGAVDRPFAAGHYERRRWFGNSIVQGILFVGFSTLFVTQIVVGAIVLVRRRAQCDAPAIGASWHGFTWLTVVLGFLNVALTAGLVVLIVGLANPWNPTYPSLLNWLPLAGSLSACLTLALAMRLFIRWQDLVRVAPTNSVRGDVLSTRFGRNSRYEFLRCALGDARFAKMGLAVSAACAITFVGFLYYWNLVGLRLN